MTDFIDQTQEREERLLAMRIQAAREARRDGRGPTICPSCMGPNDRAVDDYRTCSSCFEEASGNGQV